MGKKVKYKIVFFEKESLKELSEIRNVFGTFNELENICAEMNNELNNSFYSYGFIEA